MATKDHPDACEACHTTLNIFKVSYEKLPLPAQSIQRLVQAYCGPLTVVKTRS